MAIKEKYYKSQYKYIVDEFQINKNFGEISDEDIIYIALAFYKLKEYNNCIAFLRKYTDKELIAIAYKLRVEDYTDFVLIKYNIYLSAKRFYNAYRYLNEIKNNIPKEAFWENRELLEKKIFNRIYTIFNYSLILLVATWAFIILKYDVPKTFHMLTSIVLLLLLLSSFMKNTALIYFQKMIRKR